MKYYLNGEEVTEEEFKSAQLHDFRGYKSWGQVLETHGTIIRDFLIGSIVTLVTILSIIGLATLLMEH